MANTSKIEIPSLEIYFQTQTNAIKRELKGAGERLHNAELLIETMSLENLELLKEIKNLREENAALKGQKIDGNLANGASEMEPESEMAGEVSTFNSYHTKAETIEDNQVPLRIKLENIDAENSIHQTQLDFLNVLFGEQPSSSSVSPPAQTQEHFDLSSGGKIRNWKRQYYQQKKERECNYCHKIFFATPGNFKKHYYTHFPKNLFTCELCMDYTTPFKHSYLRHMQACKGYRKNAGGNDGGKLGEEKKKSADINLE